MWQFKRLVLKNFRSFEEQEFVFRNRETFLIQGQNLTDTGSESNGSGKSSIGEALRYVLGLPIYVATLTDLINYYSDTTSVTLDMQNSMSNEFMTVTRTTPRKGSSSLVITVNGIDQKDKFATLPEGDKFIISKIGISKEDLLNFFLISKEKYTSFLSGSDTAKKELINRFSKADVVDGIDKLVEEDIAPLRKGIDLLTIDKNKAEGRVEGYEGDLLNLQEGSDGSISETIREKEEDIVAYESVLKFYKNYTLILKGRKQKVEKVIEVKSTDNEKQRKYIAEIDVEIQSIRKRKRTISAEVAEFNNAIAIMDSMLAGLVECPECHTKFNPTEDVDVDDTNTLLEEYIKEVDKCEKRDLELDKDIEICNRNIQNHNDIISANNTYSKKASSLVRKIDAALRGIGSDEYRLEDELAEVREQLDHLKQDDKQKRISELESKILAEKDAIEGIATKIGEKVAEIADIEIWKARFTSFKSYLANKSLSSIQGYSNLYLERMGTNLNIRLDGFKQNKDGSIREKITPTILRNGMVEGSGSFKNYSGGERCRIDITPTLACQHLINLSSPTGGLDYLMVDEITEGLDPLGVESLAKSIQSLGITCNIISHVSHNQVFANIVTVVKENGVSRIVEL